MALEAKWKSDKFQQENWEKDPDVVFEEVLHHYLTTRPKDQTENAKKLDLGRGRQLMRFYTGVVMNTISGKEVRKHKQARMQEISAATMNRELVLLSAAINQYNLDFELNLPNPVKGRKLKEPEGRLRWLTRAEAASLIRSAETNTLAPYLADIVVVALHTGMRIGEILSLEWRHIDMQTGLIHLQTHNTKAKKRRSVPINKTARHALLSRLNFRSESCPKATHVFTRVDGRKIASIKKSFKTTCANADIEDFRIHDMRHTCAAWLVTAGVPLIEVRDLLGHSNTRMTERYAHLAPDNIRSAVSVLDKDVKLKVVK